VCLYSPPLFQASTSSSLISLGFSLLYTLIVPLLVSNFPPLLVSKRLPLFLVLGAVFIEQRGAACCCAWGAGGHRARSPNRCGFAGHAFTVSRYMGAWGFRFWEQHAGRERTMSTLFWFYLFIYYYLYLFYLWGSKNGLQQMPPLYNTYRARVLRSKFYKDKQN
jgi:hypothetical protein